MSVEVLAVSIFAIISMFLFRNHTRAIGVGLIILIVSYILIPSGLNPSNNSDEWINIHATIGINSFLL